MPVRTVKSYPDQCYHIYNRGAMKHTLFYSTSYYELFRNLMMRYAEDCGISIIAFSLLPNHFHILVRVDPGGDVAEFMMRLCGRYSFSANRKLKRRGTAFEGRYHMKHVDSESYFKTLCRYIDLNPVEAGLVSLPEQYEYSSYKVTMGLRPNDRLRTDVLLAMFGGRAVYERYVLEGIHDKKIACPRLAEVLAEIQVV